MLRRRKEGVLFCPNVGRIWFCVHFATCYDGDLDEFDVTINIKNINTLPIPNQRSLKTCHHASFIDTLPLTNHR